MTAVQSYELRDFFSYVISVFERLDIPYMVVGGFAAIFYGEPRLTIDVDIVADIRLAHVPAFIQAFPIPDYYVSEEGVRDSIARCYPFNVIQPSTGAKVDIVPMPPDPFTRLALQRRQRLEYDEAGQTASFITAEDIIIAKLIAYRETQSDKHFRDARGVLMLQWDTIDLNAVRRGARGAGVEQLFEQLLEIVHNDMA